MKKRKRTLGSLSVAETQSLLGSDRPISIGKVPTDPIGMRTIAAVVSERLVSRGGRPSDPAWTIVKKVPMRPDTWKAFSRRARELQQQKIRVSAGQLAAITLERGLEIALCHDEVEQPTRTRHAVSPDALHKARLVHSAIDHCGFF